VQERAGVTSFCFFINSRELLIAEKEQVVAWKEGGATNGTDDKKKEPRFPAGAFSLWEDEVPSKIEETKNTTNGGMDSMKSKLHPPKRPNR